MLYLTALERLVIADVEHGMPGWPELNGSTIVIAS